MWSRVGTGSAGAAAAVAGFALGATAIAHAPLAALDGWLGSAGSGVSLPRSLAGALGTAPWVVVAGGLALIALALGRLPAAPSDGRHWPWAVTGTALGILGILAWVTGAPSGWHWGLSMTGPSRSLVEAVLQASAAPATWGTAMLVGVPLGAWASARAIGPVGWRWIPAPALARRFSGGVLMGVGGTLAAGCNIGNALTGLSVLSMNSVLATLGIAGGGALAIRRARSKSAEADRREGTSMTADRPAGRWK